MSAPNLVNVATVTSKVAGLAFTTSAADLVANSAASGKVLRVGSIVVSNIDGSNNVDITVQVIKSGLTTFRLAYLVTVPAKASLVLIDKNSLVNLEEGDKIQALASSNSRAEAVVSYEELS